MIDALLWSDRGRGPRVVVLVGLLVLLGWLAVQRLSREEPAIRDLLAAPARYDGRRVQFITHASIEHRADGLTLVDGPWRLGVRTDTRELPDRVDVSVDGVFHARGPGGAPFVAATRVLAHPLRPWKKAVSGVAALALLLLLLRGFRVAKGGLAPCRTS